MSNREHSKFDEWAINFLTLIVMLLIIIFVCWLVVTGIKAL